MFQIVREFILELSVPNRCSACAIAQRVTGLDHKLGNHSVEDHPLEVSTARVTHEVLYSLGGLLREEAHMNVSERRVDRGGVCERGWAPSGDRSSGCDVLLFSGRTLVKDVSVARFGVPTKMERRVQYFRQCRQK